MRRVDMMHYLPFLAAIAPQTKVEAATDAIALAGITSPVWLHLLQDTSQVFALLLPIAAVIWIVTQTVVKIFVTRRAMRLDRGDDHEN